MSNTDSFPFEKPTTRLHENYSSSCNSLFGCKICHLWQMKLGHMCKWDFSLSNMAVFTHTVFSMEMLKDIYFLYFLSSLVALVSILSKSIKIYLKRTAEWHQAVGHIPLMFSFITLWDGKVPPTAHVTSISCHIYSGSSNSLDVALILIPSLIRPH